MLNFETYTLDNAPEASRAPLQILQNALGLVPNLAAKMAAAPALISSFVAVFGANRTLSTLTNDDRHILLLSNAVANGCEWCVAFHSYTGARDGVDLSTIIAIRNGTPIINPRHAALNHYTTRLIQERGKLDQAELEDFMAAGFTQQNLLEVIAVVAASTLANYAGNIVDPDLDPMLERSIWKTELRSA